MDNNPISIDSRITDALRDEIRDFNQRVEKYICCELNSCQNLTCTVCPVGKLQKMYWDFFYEELKGEKDD